MLTHNGPGICDVAADLFGQPVPQLNNDLKLKLSTKAHLYSVSWDRC